jgi:hypothetical protein
MYDATQLLTIVHIWLPDWNTVFHTRFRRGWNVPPSILIHILLKRKANTNSQQMITRLSMGAFLLFTPSIKSASSGPRYAVHGTATSRCRDFIHVKIIKITMLWKYSPTMRLFPTKGHYGVGFLSNPVHLMMDTEQISKTWRF